MQHDARSVANQIIGRMRQSGRPVTPMQALKLAYYCHAWMLGLYRRPLLKQPVEAWRYGPVVPEIYDSLRRYGGEAIMGEIELEPLGVIEYEYDDAETDLIDQVCQKYGHLSGIRLSAMTHAQGSPWEQVWRQYGQNAVIPDPLIEKHYSDLAAKS